MAGVCTCGVAAAIEEAKAVRKAASPLARARWKAERERFEVMLLEQIRRHALPEPKRQFFWHPTRLWHEDFAWPERTLLVGVQGGIWRRGGGAHSHPTKILDDIEKAAEIATMGWRFLPVTTDQVKSSVAIGRVVLAYYADPGEQAALRRVATEAPRNHRRTA